MILLGHKAFAVKVALIDLAISFNAVNKFAVVLATTWSIVALLVMMLIPSRFQRVRFACATFIATVDLVYWIFLSLDYTMFYASVQHKPPLLIDHLLHTIPAVFACLDLLFSHPPVLEEREHKRRLIDVCILPVLYLALLFFVKLAYDRWPYPFLHSWNIWVVVLASTLLVDLNVVISQVLSHFISFFTCKRSKDKL